VNVVVALLIDAVTNKLPVLTAAAEPVATVKLNVLPSPLVKVSVFELTLPVTINEPVLTEAAEPVATVRANVLPSPLVNVSTFDVALPVTIRLPVLTVAAAFKANEAVVANEAVTVKLLMFEPVPSVRMLPEICTRSS
jgi:hypothetical protein